MNNQELLDSYSDYSISAFGATTATGLAELLDGKVSHDRIRRLLAGRELTSADVWHMVKPHVRRVQQADGCLIIDDSIVEKPYTDENAIVYWHFDHASDSMIKGINFMTVVYRVGDLALLVGFQLVAKPEQYIDKKDGKTKRRSPVSKNEHYRALL